MDRMAFPSVRQVSAVVVEVMPATGLAFAEDASGATWGIPRALGIDALRPGSQVLLDVTDYGRFSIATRLSLAGGRCSPQPA